MQTTASLLTLIQKGDEAARERLVRRFLPTLQRWARGRLPSGLRDLADTDDLVQVTFLRALDQVDRFVPTRKGAFLAYLRRILQNQIRDEIRRARRRPGPAVLEEQHPDDRPSPLEAAIGGEALERYEAALARLTEEQQEAVLLRIELGFTHNEVAEALGCPSANAARMLVSRALVSLVEVMDEG
jgi:RNA polymerase sigma-70 factor (ECF subfamily)